MKTCYTCKITKELAAYSVNNYAKDGLCQDCKDCQKEQRSFGKPPKPKTYQDYLRESGYAQDKIESWERTLQEANKGIR